MQQKQAAKREMTMHAPADVTAMIAMSIVAGSGPMTRKAKSPDTPETSGLSVGSRGGLGRALGVSSTQFPTPTVTLH